MQLGLRWKAETRDQIFNLRIIKEEACEFNVPQYSALIDYKVFDSLRLSMLWTSAEEISVSDAVIKPHVPY